LNSLITAADIEFSADDMMSILLHVMAQGVETHTTASIIADLDYVQKFHFMQMTQSELGYVSWLLPGSKTKIE
jgi:hypothetical protein